MGGGGGGNSLSKGVFRNTDLRIRFKYVGHVSLPIYGESTRLETTEKLIQGLLNPVRTGDYYGSMSKLSDSHLTVMEYLLTPMYGIVNLWRHRVRLALVELRRTRTIDQPVIEHLEFTLLHLAVVGRSHHMVRMLVDYGANVDQSDRFDRSPYQWAIRLADERMVEMMDPTYGDRSTQNLKRSFTQMCYEKKELEEENSQLRSTKKRLLDRNGELVITANRYKKRCETLEEHIRRS